MLVDIVMSFRRVSRLICGAALATLMVLSPQHLLGAVVQDAVVALKCDNTITPLGIDDLSPRFSWQMVSSRRGASQTAYEVMVASSADLLGAGKPDVWDSGKMASSVSVDIHYAGTAFAPRHRYYWQVRIWNDQGSIVVSPASWWETGLLKGDEWRAKWVANDPKIEQDDRAADPTWISTAVPVKATAKGEKPDLNVQFRLNFHIAPQPVEAKLLITAKNNLGLWVNGTELAKGGLCHAGIYICPWGTFQQIDVTKELHEGANVIAAEATKDRDDKRRGGLIALLTVKLADGSIVRFKSGTDWKATRGQPSEWHEAKYKDDSWPQAIVEGKIGETAYGFPWPPEPASLFRKDFEAHSKVRSARLYATALGSYIPYLNGKRVGDQVLAPGWTDYKQELSYQTYDVTELVEKGTNVLGVCLGDGWYASGLVIQQRRFSFGDPPLRFKAQLEIEYEDGSRQTIVSDESWHTKQSPILKSDIYNGEDYDARLEDKNWDTSKHSGAGWSEVALAATPGAEVKINAEAYPPIRVEMLLHPKSITETSKGVFLVDLGQDMVGTEKILARGPSGQTIKLQFGEVLTPDGKFYRDNMRGAAQEDDFTLKGSGDEVFEPSFTYHGFRYIQVSNYPGKLHSEDISGVVFHTDAPFTMNFHTHNEIIDKLVTNILWGQRGNFMSVPTDCPQRDERLGWMGDAEVFWRTASYDMDLDSFSRKFGLDMRIAQTPDGEFTDISPRVLDTAGQGTPGWADAGIVIPWTAYSQYGDTKILEQSWDSMQRWMSYQLEHYPSYVVNRKGYGDWLAIDSQTPQDVIGTAFFAYDAGLMSKIARALGKTKDAAFYDEELKKITAAFQAKFVNADGTIANGSQTTDVLALRMGLVPEKLRPQVADALVADIKLHKGHLTTGFLGTPYLMGMLTETGHVDTAFDLLMQDSYPSWEYMVKHGATTMWERWNGDQMMGEPSMNSYNHYAYGSVGEWLYRYVAGIDLDPKAPAFHTIVLRPHFSASLGDVEASYDSPYGAIRSDWKMQGKDVSWTVALPANTTATAYLAEGTVQLSDASSKDISSVSCTGSKDGGSICSLVSGTYMFTIHQP